MHDSRTVANYLLQIAKSDGNPITPMKLLKLVYIAHGWSLGLYNRPLIRDEVQAWKYGPVIPRLYAAIKDYKSRPIDQPLDTAWNDKLEPWEHDLIKQVYAKYGKMTGVQLSSLTHKTNTPWDYVYDEDAFGEEIPTELIQSHYAALVRAAQ